MSGLMVRICTNNRLCVRSYCWGHYVWTCAEAWKQVPLTCVECWERPAFLFLLFDAV